MHVVDNVTLKTFNMVDRLIVFNAQNSVLFDKQTTYGEEQQMSFSMMSFSMYIKLQVYVKHLCLNFQLC